MQLTPDQETSLVSSLKIGDYNLLLGAAASLGTLNSSNQSLPLANSYREMLCGITRASQSTSLARVFSMLNEDEVEEHVTKFLSAANPGAALQAIPHFIWRRVFTLNVDDALETAYNTSDRYQSPNVINYVEPYEEFREKLTVPLIHLHGFVRRPDDGYIFSRESYHGIIKSANPWNVTLAQFLGTEPFFVVGSSLEEDDIDYFLSTRTPSSARPDRGPSVWVEPSDGREIAFECERRGLVHFRGTAEDFFDYLLRLVTERPRPEDFIRKREVDLLPSDIDPSSKASFFADFELAPNEPVDGDNDIKFLLGKQPTWSDLTNDLDIPRTGTTLIREKVEQIFRGSENGKIVYLDDDTGAGKSTVLRRAAFDLAKAGYPVLYANADSRLRPHSLADMLSQIGGRLVVVIDNLADQVSAIQQVLERITKDDIVFIASDRSYRFRHVREVLSGYKLNRISLSKLSERDVKNIVRNYIVAGISSTSSEPDERLLRELSFEPIAITCCRVMNEFRPLDRIIETLLSDATAIDRSRYIATALTEHCTKAGLSYSLLAAVGGTAQLNDQFNARKPLPLTHVQGSGGSYVVPLNSTLASRLLSNFAEEHRDELFDIYVKLARAIAPRVNRKAIIKRQPEARLAARLFDYDQVVEKFLGDRSEEFYEAVREEWRWNSRYWEQLALINMKNYFRSIENGSPDEDFLSTALAHAKHAVSIEQHPLTLTTLAKVQFQIAGLAPYDSDLYGQAFDNILRAISRERTRDRLSVHPFVVLMQALKCRPSEIQLTDAQLSNARNLIEEAARVFARDPEIAQLVRDVGERGL
ncbi:SIR2 family protein [Sphingomicrobium sp. XHP0235]|uniref:P-loop NTPase n=1 Tax=Sphingomicrobium aquimarinum TaxID=3133971 RepID=UPI0031FF1CA2